MSETLGLSRPSTTYGAMEQSGSAKEMEVITEDVHPNFSGAEVNSSTASSTGRSKNRSYKYEGEDIEDEEDRWILGVDKYVNKSTKKRVDKFGRSVSSLPWHSIKIAVITTFFVATLVMFTLQEAPDEHPLSHLAAVSQESPLLHDLSYDRLDTVKLYIQIQEIVHHPEYHFPDPTIITAQIQGGIKTTESTTTRTGRTTANAMSSGGGGGGTHHGEDENYEWVNLQNHDFQASEEESVHDHHYFYLTPEDLTYEALRVRVTSNSDQAVGLKLRILELGPIVRYEVVFGLVLLVLVYVLIIFELVHRTVAALLGSFWGLAFLSILQERPGFLEVITWIDYDTIGLLFGMMVLVGIFSVTGFFEYSAVKAYKLSRGNIWHLVVMLCIFTAVTSSFLDNVTTILLVAPVTLRLCRVIDLNPLPVIMAEVIFSNIGGTATGIGDPPNILIISSPKMRASGLVDFATFTIHVAPGAVIALIVTLFFVKWAFGKQLSERAPSNPIEKEIEIWKRTVGKIADQGGDEERVVREKLLDYVTQLQSKLGDEEEDEGDGLKVLDVAELEDKYKITDMPLFIKTCAVLGVVILLFFLHPFIHSIQLSLPWIALLGALVLLVLSGIEDIQEVIEKVEMVTLLFFAGLFVLMRCVEEMGVMLYIADLTSSLIGTVPEGKMRLAFAVFLLIWVCAIVSALIDNIPFTTTMIPIVVKLASSGLGLPLQPLTWATAFGACLGGNGTLIGASANVVAAGIAEQHGSPISFNYSFKMGFPCMLVSTAVATVYMLIFHVMIPWYSG